MLDCINQFGGIWGKVTIGTENGKFEKYFLVSGKW